MAPDRQLKYTIKFPGRTTFLDNSYIAISFSIHNNVLIFDGSYKEYGPSLYEHTTESVHCNVKTMFHF